ncbi:DNA polymerase III subunit epsilon [Paracoccaceae bacterium]|nr:DNA polymerase III subunit epsilon [Paracoccaceae bacterium]
MREVILDTETTGLNPDKGDRIVEIGAIELVNHIPTGNTFHCYLNPLLEGEMPIDSFKVHGLSADFLSDKPLFSEMIEKLIIFIGDSKLIIHNAKFDIGFINHEIKRLEYSNFDVYDKLPYKEIPSEIIIDTLEIAKKIYPGKSVSLDSLCIKFGIDNKREGKHGALIDSEILSEVYLELAGGKQPCFQFSQEGSETIDRNKKTFEKRNFIRKHPIAERRVSQKEMELHIEFISRMEKNFWY